MWLLEIPKDTTNTVPGFGIGDVIHVSAHGGFFVEVVHVKIGLATIGSWPYVWLVLARPLLGRTMTEKLSTLYKEALNAQGISEVEVALHVAEFAKRAMEIAGEAERNAGTEGVVSTLCDLL